MGTLYKRQVVSPHFHSHLQEKQCFNLFMISKGRDKGEGWNEGTGNEKGWEELTAKTSVKEAGKNS